MSKRVMAMLVGVVALAVLVAGCGSSDDETTTVEVSLTKAQFVKQGSKVCAEELKTMSKGLKAFSDEHDLTKKLNKEDTEELVETVFQPGFEGQFEGLGELSPPKGDEKQVEAILTQFEEGLDKGSENKEKFVAELSTAMRALEKYGIKECDGLYL